MAVYAPGNSLAVYTLSHTTTGVEIDGEVATPGFVREAGRIVFDEISAAATLPRCIRPVGEGANRPIGTCPVSIFAESMVCIT